MAEVIFEEDSDNITRPAPVSAKPSFMVNMVYKTGLAKTPKGANYVLLGIIVVCVLVAILSLFAGGLIGNTSTSSASAASSEPGAV